MYFRYNELLSSAHCRGGYYFFLDKKVAKNQDGKNLLPTGPAPGPVFRRAFSRFFWIVILSGAKNLLKEVSEHQGRYAKKILRSAQNDKKRVEKL